MIIYPNFEFLCKNTNNDLKINTYMGNSCTAINHNYIFKRKNKFPHLSNSRGKPISVSNSKLTLYYINWIIEYIQEELRKIGFSSGNTTNAL